MRRSLAIGAVAALLAADIAAGQAVAPVRPIRAQTIIAPGDLQVLEEDMPGAVTDLDALMGLEARVTLYTGRPIMPDQVGPPAVIERNTLVRMRYAQGSLTIATEGRALDRAGVGERLRVMNLASRQIVTGRVGPDGSIEVGQ